MWQMKFVLCSLFVIAATCTSIQDASAEASIDPAVAPLEDEGITTLMPDDSGEAPTAEPTMMDEEASTYTEEPVETDSTMTA
jgi:hypothetical protein